MMTFSHWLSLWSIFLHPSSPFVKLSVKLLGFKLLLTYNLIKIDYTFREQFPWTRKLRNFHSVKSSGNVHVSVKITASILEILCTPNTTRLTTFINIKNNNETNKELNNRNVKLKAKLIINLTLIVIIPVANAKE